MFRSSLHIWRRRLPCWLATGRLTPGTTKAAHTLRREGDDLLSEWETPTPVQHNLGPLVLQSASRWSHHTALECGVTGEKVTYASLQDSALRWGGALQRAGVGRGQVVALMMLNSPNFAIAFLGSKLSGAIVSPMNPTFTPGEVSRQISDSGAKVLVVDSILESVAAAGIADLQTPPQLYVVGNSKDARPDFLQIIRDTNTPFADVTHAEEEEGTSVLMYSSGTSGPPKGAPISSTALRANLPAVFHPEVFPYAPTTAETQETVMGLMPFFHAYGVYVVLCMSMMVGAKVVTLPQFLPDVFIATITKHKIGVLHLVPPLLQFLVGHPLVTPAHLASVRLAMCTSAPCSPHTAHALKEKAPNPVFFQEAYGMTETMPTHYTPLDQEKIGSCGTLLAGVKARVMDPTSGLPLPSDQPGELWIKSSGIITGYHNNLEATQETITQDGWLKTGDVAKYDDEGFFYIVDRIKELIKVKGHQVSPAELEDELLQHQGVAEAGVVGVSDTRAGEVPRAYVVKKDPNLTEEDLVTFLAGRLAPHKHLAGGVHFIDQLPKNVTGKILRRELKNLAAVSD
ncbi:4-coumarate--CoA ligase 3-like [Homarus americanus]|uniref:4-coumarate--CoA ligase 3-like n=1 Tax=Homarus americanus TaxID=6706 RepID=UPI001C45102D|nr:4-coumarate--CoA ligase 3-like [Homarus americanus]XP_042232441.1 4-coumarate--CoA ligase 3-like [Homarus americanus]